MTGTWQVTDPDAALVALACHLDQLLAADPAEWSLDQRATAGSLLIVPRAGGLGYLSTDVFARKNLSHPRTSVRSEGRRT
jgi:hypothetical protein